MNDIELIRKTVGREKTGISEEDLVIIQRAAGQQMNRQQIAAMLGIDPSTLRKLEREYPSISLIIEKEKIQRVSPIAERALTRALEDDKMTQFALERKGGWERKDGARININNSNQVVEESGNKLLDTLSESELAHYRSLTPADMLAIIGMEDPGYEVPDPEAPSADVYENEPPREEVIEASYQDGKDTGGTEPHVRPKKDDSESKKLKATVYARLIDEHFLIPGLKQGVRFLDQSYVLSEDLDYIMRKSEIVNSRDKKIFTDLLLEKGAVKKRRDVEGLRATLYVGCKLRTKRGR